MSDLDELILDGSHFIHQHNKLVRKQAAAPRARARGPAGLPSVLRVPTHA